MRAVGDALAGFRVWCEGECFKCSRIVLARGAQIEQPMATWRHKRAVLSDVLSTATTRAKHLHATGYIVVRVKIEADPHNEDVPATDSDVLLHPARNYFEHHVKLMRVAAARRDLLLNVCLDHGAHLSRNAWREPTMGFEERFVTLRSYGMGRHASEGKLQDLLRALAGVGEWVIEIESEYCVYDSNLALDDGWLPHGVP